MRSKICNFFNLIAPSGVSEMSGLAPAPVDGDLSSLLVIYGKDRQDDAKQTPKLYFYHYCVYVQTFTLKRDMQFKS